MLLPLIEGCFGHWVRLWLRNWLERIFLRLFLDGKVDVEITSDFELNRLAVKNEVWKVLAFVDFDFEHT